MKIKVLSILMTLAAAQSSYAAYEVLNKGCESKVREYMQLGIIREDYTAISPEQIPEMSATQRGRLEKDIDYELISFDNLQRLLVINSCELNFHGSNQETFSFKTYQNIGKAEMRKPIRKPTRVKNNLFDPPRQNPINDEFGDFKDPRRFHTPKGNR